MEKRVKARRRRAKSHILVVAFLLSGCAASQSLKLADDAITQGDYYRAAQSYLTVLEGAFKKSEALSKLAQVAEPAYMQKLEMAENLVRRNQHEAAIREYRELSNFLGALRQHNVLNFQTINVGAAIATASQAAAEQYYAEAELHYANQRFSQAIDGYQRAISLAGSYRDSGEKMASSYYQLGVLAEKAARYRHAIDQYLKADDARAGYRDSRRRAGMIQYHLADHFLNEGHCRQAYDDFGLAREYGAPYADLAAKIAEAKECGTIKIAFMEFENNTGRGFPGMDLGDFIFESIKTKTQEKASDFIRLMDREQLDVLLREQRIDEGQLVTGGSLRNTIEGVDFLVFGKINQLEKTHKGSQRSVRQATYQYGIERAYTDSKGKEKTRTEWIEQPMSYTIISDARKIQMSGAIRVVDVRSSEVVINYIIDRVAADDIEYAQGYKARHDLNGENIKLDDSIKRLAQARQELKEENSLAREMIDLISDEMANRLLNTLDVAGNAPDPTVIPLELPVD